MQRSPVTRVIRSFLFFPLIPVCCFLEVGCVLRESGSGKDRDSKMENKEAKILSGRRVRKIYEEKKMEKLE